MRTLAFIRGKLYYKKLVFNESVFIDLMSGFFPKMLRRMFCYSPDLDCKLCDLNNRCAYAYLFEPILSGEKVLVVQLPDIKIPFGFKWYLNKDGGEFLLSMFGGCKDYLFEILQTLSKIGEIGLGHEKMKFEIGEIETLDAEMKKVRCMKIEKGMSECLEKIAFETIDKTASTFPLMNMKIEFCSDFDLFRTKKAVNKTELFPTLYKRIRDRLRALFVIYLDEDIPLQMKGLSNKTKDVINVSINKNIYEFKGTLSYFRFLFLLGSYFNIGRRCAFGKGSYKIII